MVIDNTACPLSLKQGMPNDSKDLKLVLLYVSLQLHLHGLAIDEKDNTGTDLEFLEQMMKINEEIYEMEPSSQRLKEIRDLNIRTYVSFTQRDPMHAPPGGQNPTCIACTVHNPLMLCTGILDTLQW